MFRLQTFHIMRDRSHGIVMFGILVHAISGIESIEYKIWRELSKKNYASLKQLQPVLHGRIFQTSSFPKVLKKVS